MINIKLTKKQQVKFKREAEQFSAEEYGMWYKCYINKNSNGSFTIYTENELPEKVKQTILNKQS